MGILKDISEIILKFGEVFVSKTEEYTQVIRHMLEIKKLENETEKIKLMMADYIFNKIKKGDKSINFKDKEIRNYYEEILHLHDEAGKIKKSMEKLKSSKPKKI